MDEKLLLSLRKILKARLTNIYIYINMYYFLIYYKCVPMHCYLLAVTVTFETDKTIIRTLAVGISSLCKEGSQLPCVVLAARSLSHLMNYHRESKM